MPLAVRFDAYIDIDVEVVEVARPVPRPRQVLVKVGRGGHQSGRSLDPQRAAACQVASRVSFGRGERSGALSRRSVPTSRRLPSVTRCSGLSTPAAARRVGGR
jgi:hypothetical protein